MNSVQQDEQTGAGRAVDDYVIRVHDSVLDIDRQNWNALLETQAQPTPFMRHEYLAALEASGSACPATGWTPRFITLHGGGQLQAACPLYLKTHSYGEYVFDWAWAQAYEQHGLSYYPKALVAVPFTPVPGSRLLARDAAARRALLRALLDFCRVQRLSSLHVLFGDATDQSACADAALMPRQTVQFHWRNAAAAPDGQAGYADFDAMLAHLSQDKRKKIRQERRKVAEAGVRFRALAGDAITPAHWDFFYRCYERTYLEHGNAPYLSPAFFGQMADTMPRHWLMFIAERAGRPLAASLIALQRQPELVAYGRYWGALERVDCLHFEACYYQPLQWCIANGFARFEGGAQGEHKMARALMPVPTHSAHWLADPRFARAVDDYLLREGHGVEHYLEHLAGRSPFRAAR